MEKDGGRKTGERRRRTEVDETKGTQSSAEFKKEFHGASSRKI
jgi:hypothetical protein